MRAVKQDGGMEILKYDQSPGRTRAAFAINPLATSEEVSINEEGSEEVVADNEGVEPRSLDDKISDDSFDPDDTVE